IGRPIFFDDRGDSLQGVQSIFRRCGDGSREIASYAVTGKSYGNDMQRLGSALHDVVTHRTMKMDVEIGGRQQGAGIGIRGMAAFAAKDGRDVAILDVDLRILYDFVFA